MILALDPSLAKTGWAVLMSVGWPPPATLQGYAPLLQGSGVWTTLPADPIEHRIFNLSAAFGRAVRLDGVDTVVLEVPARTIAYGRNQGAGAGILAGLCHLNRVIGLYEGLALGLGLDLVRIHASRQPKAVRHQRVYQVWPQFGGRKSTEDQRDALALGLGYLSGSTA